MNGNQLNTTTRRMALMTLILAGEVIFFLPFVLPRIFKPTVLEVFQITNTELGVFFSVYGIVALISYLLGGPIADRFSPRKLMAGAMLLTSFGGVLLFFIPSKEYMYWIYGFWGLTTILFFWAPLMRTTRLIGKENSQGKIFGFLDGGRGLVAAIVSVGAIWILSAFLPDSSEVYSMEQKKDALQNVVLFFTSIVLGTTVLVFIAFRGLEKGGRSYSKNVSLAEYLVIAKRPEVLLQAVIILCAYSGYRVTDDFSLLASDMLDYNGVKAAEVGSIALWLRPVAAIIAGVTADKLKASAVSLFCFGLMLMGGVLMFIAPESCYSVVFLFIVVTSTSVGVYSMRGLYFAIMGEAKIPLAVTGSVVGLVSLIGYLPDIYMAPLMGVFLDKYKGLVTGHQYVFMLLSIFSVLGIISTLLFKRLIKRKTSLYN